MFACGVDPDGDLVQHAADSAPWHDHYHAWLTLWDRRAGHDQ